MALQAKARMAPSGWRLPWGLRKSGISAKTQGHSVFQRNPDQVQGSLRLGRETAAGCRHVGVACPTHEPSDSVAQCRHDLWDMATPDLRAIFIKGHIPDPMGAVLNRPMATYQGQ